MEKSNPQIYTLPQSVDVEVKVSENSLKLNLVKFWSQLKLIFQSAYDFIQMADYLARLVD